jgi:hypothetical protein
MLRFVGWFDNYGTNINTPKKNFIQIKWKKFFKIFKIDQVKIIKNNINNKNSLTLILPPKHQFISIIRNKF